MSVGLVFSWSSEAFRRWLDHELFRRFGRAKSNRSICIAAGLPENALYRMLTKGERPSPLFIERLTASLTLDPAEFRRRAGLQPALEIRADGTVVGVDRLSAGERLELHGALETALRSLGARDEHVSSSPKSAEYRITLGDDVGD